MAPTVSIIYKSLTGHDRRKPYSSLLFRVCVPGIYSDYQQQTKDSNFDDLCTPKVVAMATSSRKDSQHFAIFHLLEAISRVTVGKIFSNLAF